MTKNDLSILYRRAVAGEEIGKDTIDEVIRILHSRKKREIDLYKICQILSLSLNPSEEIVKEIEKLLSLENEDLIVQGAIQSLCIDWKLTGNYINFLTSILNLSHWENFDLSISSAAMALAEYFSSNPDDKRILCVLDIHESLDTSGIDYGEFAENIYFILHAFVHGYDVGSLMDRRKNFSQRQKTQITDRVRYIISRAH